MTHSDLNNTHTMRQFWRIGKTMGIVSRHRNMMYLWKDGLGLTEKFPFWTVANSLPALVERYSWRDTSDVSVSL